MIPCRNQRINAHVPLATRPEVLKVEHAGLPAAPPRKLAQRNGE